VVPSGFTRYVDSTNSSYSTRANQYKYTANIFATTCSIYCGPRSFLTRDSSNYLICQRDNTVNFWGASSPSGYQQYCIPDTDKNSNCGLIIPILSGYTACDSKNYASGPYSSYQCCYLDAQDPRSTFDLTFRKKNTTLYSLRNAE
jgi:hypothetical protein